MLTNVLQYKYIHMFPQNKSIPQELVYVCRWPIRNVILTSFLHRNYAVALFWWNGDLIINWYDKWSPFESGDALNPLGTWTAVFSNWALSHYLDQYCLMVNWAIMNKLQWNFNQNTTRQIWGIWKLRPAFSPETPNLGQNRWCFVQCDLEIWWMTLENNRASPLCSFKLFATFHSHLWIQTGVTVRKRPIWVKFDEF